MSLPEAADLHRLVREARPRPREAWVAELDARVAAGFPRVRRRRLPALPRRAVLVPALGTVACLLVAVVVAVSLLGGSGSQPEAGSPTEVDRHTLVEPAPKTAPGATASGGEAAGVPPAQRKVERSATLALATDTGELDRV